jgi:hypothetical protein
MTLMAVSKMIVDQWNPSNVRYRRETLSVHDRESGLRRNWLTDGC